MQMPLSDRQVYCFRTACIVILLASAACYVIFTIHWPWMWDTQVMHYTSFLADHGKVPYRDIYDINLPGSYLTERWAIAIFGGGDIGWRLYEFTLLASMTIAAIVIALPTDWLGGLFAGVLFAILHGSEGPTMAAERDEVMTVLLLAGYAFLFTSMRRRRPAWMVPFGLCVGMAALIKPTTAPFIIALLLFPVFVLRKSGKRPAPYLLLGLSGLGIALGILFNFLLPLSLKPFIFILSKLVPYYSHLGHASFRYLLAHSLPLSFLFFFPLAALLAMMDRTRANWEMWAIRIGIVFGAVSYFVQGKGYDYHRYTLIFFGLLWVGMVFTTQMKNKGWQRNLSMVGIAIALLLVLPHNVNLLRHERRDSNPFADRLQADLIRLGGSRLDSHVQCLDVVTGCYSALYRLKLMQSTGFMGDLQFFAPDDGSVVPYYRNLFWNQIHADPPQVIVLSSEWFGARLYSFDKLNAWPQFRDYLASAYDLDVTREFGSFDGNVLAYRIYVLKNMAR